MITTTLPKQLATLSDEDIETVALHASKGKSRFDSWLLDVAAWERGRRAGRRAGFPDIEAKDWTMKQLLQGLFLAQLMSKPEPAADVGPLMQFCWWVSYMMAELVAEKSGISVNPELN